MPPLMPPSHQLVDMQLSSSEVPVPEDLPFAKDGRVAFVADHLHESGMMPKDTFSVFKEFLRQTALQHFPIMKVTHKEQPLEDWQAFVGKNSLIPDHTPYTDRCLFCEERSTSETPINQRLKDLLTANALTDVAPAMRSFGIYHDGHLELLHALSVDERLKVVRDIPGVPHGIDAFDLEKMLTAPDIVQTPRFRRVIIMTCSDHRNLIQAPKISPSLHTFLKSKQLDALVPAAAVYGLVDEVRFNRFRVLDETDCVKFFESAHTRKVSLFYHRLLRLPTSNN
ncbi:hypothetical protein V5O48_003013 [Marasmius crinis-equi]|uniref:Uncharacterized protein n=1 Tax=Marasmius crinis-equi TaxID=585013 RepID=A0ABR3FU21_9AGAR